ncbi:ABC transporter [Thozetella sp. PMI_491]|nr:ABC transporter [Thozetella sp. PMI_491]
MASMDCLNDDSFGPAVRGCRGDFDFTQKFERILFSVIPGALFLLVAGARVLQLAYKPRLISAITLQFAKLLAITIYVSCQLSLLVLVARVDAAFLPGFSVAAVTLTFAAGLFMFALSFLEHARSLRTSALLNIYLLLTLLFDIVQARTLWLATSQHHATFARLFTASIAVKLVVIFFEAQSKVGGKYWEETERSPEETSGIYSLSVYYWLKGLFLRGYSSVLCLDDLYALDSALSAEKTASKLMEKLNERTQNGAKPSLPLALFHAFSWPYLLPAIPQLAYVAFQYSQSFFLQTLITHLNQLDEESSNNRGYGLIGACALIYLGLTLSTSYYGYYKERAASMTRACLCAAIYKKTTEITTATATAAESVTLMSSDVERVEIGIRLAHFLWSSLLQIGVGCWLLYTKLGAASAAPMVILSLCFGVFFWIMMLVQGRQSVWMEKIQTRVGFTANAISKMKYFKMLGISNSVAESIQDLRRKEIRAGNKFRVILFATFGLSYFPVTASPVATFAFISRSLDPSTLFVSLSFITLLTAPLAQLFQGLPQCLAALISLRRIETYLTEPPREDFRRQGNTGSSESHPSLENRFTASEITITRCDPPVSAAVSSGPGDDPSPPDREPVFAIKNGSFGWEDSKMVLRELDISFVRGELTMIVGPVASGKSTLCKVLLGEVPIARGSTEWKVQNSTIGYCAQTPFLYDKTLMENIIWYSPFDQNRYTAVITATMLTADIALLPSGDQTKIGSNGIVLSGGQKQRVSLARALYLETDVLVLDDVFSGLDATTETEIFRRVFGPEGIIRKRGATAIVCTHSVRHLPSADCIIVLGSDGAVVEQGSFDALIGNGKYVTSLDAIATNSASDIEDAPGSSFNASNLERPHKIVDDGDSGRQAGDWSIYLHYLRNIAARSVIVFIVLCVVSGTANNFSTVWVSYWSENAFDRPPRFYIGLYGLIGAVELFSILGVAFVGLTDIVASSGANLHRQAITTVVRAPLSLFTTTDTGTVTNLFSQDMTLVDGELPLGLLNTFIYVVILIGNFFVAAIASPYLAISYPFLLGLLYILQVFYLRTSRQLRLLDLEAKSPLYNHFLDTMSGLATIRAFGWVGAEIGANNSMLNASQRPAYLLVMIQSWLQTSLTVLVGILAIGLTALATQLRTSSSFTGASFLTLINLVNTIATAMRSYTGLETSIGAVNRLRAFSQNVKPEDSNDENRPLPDYWPNKGSITLNAVSASYSTKPNNQGTRSLALDNLSMSVQPGEKVAICGRTGSGKSSLMLLLLRLLDPLPGSHNILVDDVPIHQIDRLTLRQRFITVPQDSVFLPGRSSIKANLDPSNSASDEECITVLEAVQLSDLVRQCGDVHGNMGTESLSEGQQQLFGLGRAVLRRMMRDKTNGPTGGILLLDEMNSKLDKETDQITQKIIREQFRDYTVVMVAHKLDMVMNLCDRVFVLDQGVLVEEGRPMDLVEIRGSWFGRLWSESNLG